jgi:hypothetical protein
VDAHGIRADLIAEQDALDAVVADLRRRSGPDTRSTT